MTFSNLPTDNLYKFIMLIGVGLIIYATSFAYKDGYELEKEAILTLRDFHLLEIELDYLTQEKNPAVDKLNNQNSSTALFIPPSKKTFDVKVRKLKVEADAKQKLAEKFSKYGKLQIELAAYALILGGLFLHIGGYLWYSKAQLPIDLKAKKEMENMRKLDQKSDLPPPLS